MLDERTEILMNRRLDGELTPDESLELDKLLIRDPQGRALLEEYARMDKAAGEVIRAVVSTPAKRIEPAECSSWAGPLRRWWYSFGLVSAVAASITLAFLLSQRAVQVPMPNAAPGIAAVEGPVAGPSLAGSNLDYVANMEGPRRETNTVEQNVIGVWDDQTRSLYLLEVNSDRSLVEPTRENY